ncbi:hypothetical protein QUB70_08895 [Microcoleus sp. A003_D6]
MAEIDTVLGATGAIERVTVMGKGDRSDRHVSVASRTGYQKV